MDEYMSEVDECYLSLIQAAKVVTGVAEDGNIHVDKDGAAYNLYAKTYRARRNWSVDTYINDNKETCVHIGDFIEWAWDQGIIVDSDVLSSYANYLSPRFQLKQKLFKIKNKLRQYESVELVSLSDIFKLEEAENALKDEYAKIEAAIQNQTRITQLNGAKVEQKKFSKTDLRINGILKTIKSEMLNPLDIPYGGKAKIKARCLDNPELFTDATFDKAWKKASKEGLVSVKDKEKYRGESP